jgi:hypothetical protein
MDQYIKNEGFARNNLDRQNYEIYYAIKFSSERMMKQASKHKVFGDLDISNIRLPFDHLM